MTAIADAELEIPADPSPSSAADGKQQMKEASAALAELTRPIAGLTRAAQALGVVAGLLTIVPFVALTELGEELLGAADRDRIVTLCWLVLLGAGLRGAAQGIGLALTHFADVRLQAHLRRRLVRHLGTLPLGWFSSNSSGRVRKAAQDDAHDLHQIVAHHPVEMVIAVVSPLTGLGYLIWLDWRLALLAIATLPVYIGAYAFMMRGSADKMIQMNEAGGRISSAVIEFLSGIAVVKTFGKARRAHRAYAEAAHDYAVFFGGWMRPFLKLEVISLTAVSAPVIGAVTVSGGLWFTHEGWVTPIEALVTVLIAITLPAAIMPLGFGANTRRTAGAAAVRIRDLLAEPALPAAEDPAIPEGNDVEFDAVRFSYDGEHDVLRDVTLRCAPGTVTALVGPSGSGKSTLATLVPRFGDPASGAVRIGGVDVRDIAADVLYRRVGFVLQQVELLRGTVAENVRLARPDASDAELEAACRAAQIHDRILELPRGYDSVIGEDARFSGGEGQRVAIARALLADTPILVLDEATSFADPDSEAAIQDALSTLAVGRTVIVIAHRLSTIAGADQIVVLDHGRLVEQGTHADLLRRDGAYAAMWAAHSDPADSPVRPTESTVRPATEGDAR